VKKRKTPGKGTRLHIRSKPSLDVYNRLRFGDFSEVEDNDHSFWFIRKLANDAGNYAAAEAKARGLATAYVRGNKLVKVTSRGETIVIAPKLNRPSFYVKYKPATILHAAKK
jgi:hypothetical protein